MIFNFEAERKPTSWERQFENTLAQQKLLHNKTATEFELAAAGIWTTRDGRRYFARQLTNTHLKNIIRIVHYWAEQTAPETYLIIPGTSFLQGEQALLTVDCFDYYEDYPYYPSEEAIKEQMKKFPFWPYIVKECQLRSISLGMIS